jgi:hypothetical protein
MCVISFVSYHSRVVAPVKRRMKQSARERERAVRKIPIKIKF